MAGEWVDGWAVNGWAVNGWAVNGWAVNGWMDGRVDGQAGREWMGGEWVDGWASGWVDGWINARRYGWMERAKSSSQKGAINHIVGRNLRDLSFKLTCFLDATLFTKKINIPNMMRELSKQHTLLSTRGFLLNLGCSIILFFSPIKFASPSQIEKDSQ